MLKAQKPGFRLIISVFGYTGRLDDYFLQLKQFFDIHLAQGISQTKSCTQFALKYRNITHTWHMPRYMQVS
uniref:Glucuronosyltransferase n=1 Tax=Panagrellus redivivus TaxID=6233 RepID=A0A7E4VFC3_PANRE